MPQRALPRPTQREVEDATHVHCHLQCEETRQYKKRRWLPLSEAAFAAHVAADCFAMLQIAKPKPKTKEAVANLCANTFLLHRHYVCSDWLSTISTWREDLE